MTLFVGQLPLAIDKKHLRRLFAGQGRVVSLKLPLNRLTGTRRGFAFVDMPDRGEALRAIKNLNGRTLENKAIVVELAPF